MRYGPELAALSDRGDGTRPGPRFDSRRAQARPARAARDRQRGGAAFPLRELRYGGFQPGLLQRSEPAARPGRGAESAAARRPPADDGARAGARVAGFARAGPDAARLDVDHRGLPSEPADRTDRGGVRVRDRARDPPRARHPATILCPAALTGGLEVEVEVEV